MRFKNIRLISNTVGETSPEFGCEVEQWLSVTDDGQAELVAYTYGGDVKHLREGRRAKVDIGEKKAQEILDALANLFSTDLPVLNATGYGRWQLMVTERNKTIHLYAGALIGHVIYDGHDLTKYLRKRIPIENLTIFGQTYYGETDTTDSSKIH